MDFSTIAHEWQTHGFVILPGYLNAGDLRAAQATFGSMFPSAEGFHSGSDPRRHRYIDDEFAGIDTFPFGSTELSLLTAHPRLIELSENLLGGSNLRIYSAEAWAKYTGAADYDQDLHRDYLNHTVLVPTDAAGFQQLEMFVYLVDVPDALGPPHLVSRTHTGDLPTRPNWYPRIDTDPLGDDWTSAAGRPELYASEISAAGPAGTVVAFGLNTFHRGTAMTQPNGARFTMHLNYRPAAAEWGHRQAWADRSHEPAWYDFVERATPRQLQLFGFPPPQHPYWTPDTLAGLARRYPALDLTPWRS